MTEYDNSMKGVLFKNDKKTTDAHPAYKGNGEVNGVEVWISAWVKKSKAGQSYMSLSFENKEGQVVNTAGVAGSDAQGGSPVSAIDDDIPF